MTRQELNAIIESSIRTNGRGEITAVVMSGVLYNLADYSDSLQASIMGALANYYLKTETYSREQVNAMIAAVRQFRYMKVEERPAASADTVGIVYLVPSADPAVENVCDEWITVEDGEGGYAWELIGSTAVDLEGYVTDEELAAAIAGCLSGPRPVTHAQLLALRNAGTLVPGQDYRITDYVATTVQEDTMSANHPFDIIVKAVEPQRLSETASAAPHAGDTYFADCNLAAWRLRYAIDNEPERFEWADEENGKGVIYEMTDEYGNTAPFDFKGIMFSATIGNTNKWVYLFTVDAEFPDESRQDLYDSTVKVFHNQSVPKPPRENVIRPAYTESHEEESYIKCPDEQEMIAMGLCEEIFNEETGEFEYVCPEDPSHVCPSQQEMIDMNLCFEDYDPETHESIWNCPDPEEYGLCENYCTEDYRYFNGVAPQTLNRIYFYVHTVSYGDDMGSENYYAPIGNSFGVNCVGIRFVGENTAIHKFEFNAFGAECHDITLSGSAKNNTFEAACSVIALNGSSDRNTFGASCLRITAASGLSQCILGKGVMDTTFGSSCSKIEIGANSYSINIGNSCSNLKFGYNAQTITIGKNCTDNSFGNTCVRITMGTNCQYNRFDGACQDITMGNYCVANAFHEQSVGIRFFGPNSAAGNYFRRNEFGPGTTYVDMVASTAGGSSDYVQGYKVCPMVIGTSSSRKTVNVTRSLNYQATVARKDNGTIVVFNVAELYTP